MPAAPAVNLQPTLSGPTLLLRPLTTADFEPLHAAAADPLIWELHPDPNRWQRPAFEKYFAGALASGGALAVIDQATGGIIGSSRYYQWNAQAREIFIGFTFLVRDHWGGDSNREMKRLMLDHAFGFADRVWFHVGRDNLRSRKAMEKIGGRYSHEEKVDVTGVAIDYVFYYIDRP
ncbi:MAG: hypothetical protein RLZZ385_1181 [Pseudomonadota bacterium]